MRKISTLLSIFLTIFFASFLSLYSQTYLRAGANYLYPAFEYLSKTNKPATGYNLELQVARKCKIWYGLRYTNFKTEKKDDLPINETYYQDITLFEPTLRYNFVKNQCQTYNNKLIPFVEIGGIVSFMEKTDEESLLGLGYSASGGLFYSWSMFKHCWNLELKGGYYAPNPILAAESRQSVQYLDFRLNLGVALW